jgi:hypothetical protein
MAKMSLFAAVVYTLKDAADRKRLEGTTFIELNFLSSVMFVAMAGTCRWQQCVFVYDCCAHARLSPIISAANWLKGTVELPVVGAGLLALFTAANGIVSVVKKKRSKK